MPALKDYSIFDFSRDDKDDGAVVDMNNLDTTIQEEPRKVIHALKDPSWIEAMHEELLQFKLQKVWTSVDLPNRKRAIGSKWGFRNKKDERGIVIRNKARLVTQGNTQEKRIDYDGVFAPVARIEAIRLFLAYASFKDLVVYQVDVHMYRSMIGSLMYLTSLRPDIMFAVCACARYQVNQNVSHLYAMKRIFRYLKGQPKLGLWYPKDSSFDLVGYTDSDYAGASLDRKSTTRDLLTKAFDSTAMVKTINGEAQLHALVDGKKIIITESSVRRDLQLADEEGVDCLPNSTIFEQL
ncbi:putative ribonuclease H-like domain-containing protein [Tanacetum coccineum]